jgi:HTH-type transcriptional regulator/antitoxin HigA
MTPEPEDIKTDEQYRTSLAEVGRLVADDPEPGSPDGDRLVLLAKLVEGYENTRFRFRRPGPLELSRFRVKEQASP